MIVVKAPNDVPPQDAPGFGRKTVFLAGSIEMGAAVNWQEQLARDLSDFADDLVLLNPRRDDWDSSWDKPVVCRYVPGIEREFEKGRHCFWYGEGNPTREQADAELVALVKRLLADESLRKHVGEEGRAEVVRNHTWFNRFLQLLPMVEKIRGELLR